jgi:hypothetical protein
MTRWIAVLSIVALSAGALQAGGQALPGSDDKTSCGENNGKVCEEKTVSVCTEYRGTGFELSGSGKGLMGGYKVECAKWESQTTKKYYPA